MTKTTPMMEVTRRYGHTVYTICAFGSPESADRVNGVPVLAGHFHHRGVLRHCSS